MTEQTEIVTDPAAASPAGFAAASASPTSASTDDPAAVTDPAVETASENAPVAPEIPEAYRTADGTADLAKLIERAAAADTVAAGVPESSDKYDLALPDDIKDANGEAYKIDSDNAHLKASLDVLHKYGVPQEALTALLPEYVKAVQGDIAAMNTAQQEAVNSEIAKLGDKGGDRINGVKAGLTAIFGDEAAAVEMLDEIRSFKGFERFEQFISKINGGDEASRSISSASGVGDKPRHERMYGTS